MLSREPVGKRTTWHEKKPREWRKTERTEELEQGETERQSRPGDITLLSTEEWHVLSAAAGTTICQYCRGHVRPLAARPAIVRSAQGRAAWTEHADAGHRFPPTAAHLSRHRARRRCEDPDDRQQTESERDALRRNRDAQRGDRDPEMPGDALRRPEMSGDALRRPEMPRGDLRRAFSRLNVARKRISFTVSRRLDRPRTEAENETALSPRQWWPTAPESSRVDAQPAPRCLVVALPEVSVLQAPMVTRIWRVISITGRTPWVVINERAEETCIRTCNWRYFWLHNGYKRLHLQLGTHSQTSGKVMSYAIMAAPSWVVHGQWKMECAMCIMKLSWQWSQMFYANPSRFVLCFTWIDINSGMDYVFNGIIVGIDSALRNRIGIVMKSLTLNFELVILALTTELPI